MRNDIDGLRIFRPLRLAVEGLMTQLANFAQSTIGDNPDRMLASGLPLTKEPEQRNEHINYPVERPRLQLGNTAGQIKVSVKPNRAADGIVIEERQPYLSYKEVARTMGFRATLNGYAEDEVVVLQIRYWNNLGVGPRMAKPLAIVI